MTTSTPTRGTDKGTDSVPPPVPAVRGLPSWAPWGVLGAVLVLAVVLNVAAGMSIGLLAVGAAILYALVMYTWSRAIEGHRKAADRLVTVIVTSAFLIAMVPLVSVIITVITRGLPRLDALFFSSSMRGVGFGELGGAYHAIMGTLILTGIAAIISIPIGIMTAIYLVEYGKGRLARSITFFVDVMTGIPSIVAGLFAFALFSLFFGPSIRLGIMGAFALSVLMIPVVVRAVEEMLKIVPNELREASYALGVSKWRTIVKVVVRTSIAGIGTGITLAIARVIGETAPLLITVGATTGLNFNPFDGRMASLPVYSYYEYSQPGAGVDIPLSFDRAWAAALVLMLIVVILNAIALLISRFFAPKTR